MISAPSTAVWYRAFWTIPNSKSFNGISSIFRQPAYISWLIARKLGWDAQTAARAGLLHDFCVYDFKDKLPKGEIQAYYHPRVAASTSERHFLISDKERQAILSHMFPLGPLPESREAWLISLADKLCAISEFCCFRIALARRHKVVISYS